MKSPKMTLVERRLCNMICINAIRVKEICKQRNLTLDDLYDIFIHNSHHTYARVTDLYHNNFVKDEYPDAFIYEIAKKLNVSADYLMGFTETPDIFVDVRDNDPYNNFNEVIRLINKYCIEQGIDRKNTNILAYKTGIDREVFDIIFNNKKDACWWLTTSYFIMSRLAVAFDFNFYTVMAFILNAEEDNEGKSIAIHLARRFEDEFDIKTL